MRIPVSTDNPLGEKQQALLAALLDTLRGLWLRALPGVEPYRALHTFHLLLSLGTGLFAWARLRGLPLRFGAKTHLWLLVLTAVIIMSNSDDPPKNQPRDTSLVEWLEVRG